MDYVIVPAAFLAQVRRLWVSPKPLPRHHNMLVLQLAARPQPAAPPSAEPLTDPRMWSFPLPRTLGMAEAAVAALVGSLALPALAVAAEQAAQQAAMSPDSQVAAAAGEGMAQQRCQLVADACRTAGVLPAHERRSRAKGGMSSLPTDIVEWFGLRRLRAVAAEAAGSGMACNQAPTARLAHCYDHSPVVV